MLCKIFTTVHCRHSEYKGKFYMRTNQRSPFPQLLTTSIFIYPVSQNKSTVIKTAFQLHFKNWVSRWRSFELANIRAKVCNIRRTGPRSYHVICFSTDLYIICGLLLLYTINIVWYSDLLSHASLFCVCVVKMGKVLKCLF